jgi:hypothetical protein
MFQAQQELPAVIEQLVEDWRRSVIHVQSFLLPFLILFFAFFAPLAVKDLATFNRLNQCR